jgi:glycine hydroxymethyltransferase
MFQRTNTVEKVDAEVCAAILAEMLRQLVLIEMIALEYYCSPSVLVAQGSQLTKN